PLDRPAALLPPPLRQPREQVEDALAVLVNCLRPTVLARVRAHLEVLSHRHSGEAAAAFGRRSDASGHPLVGRHLGDVLAVQTYVTGAYWPHTGDGPQGSRLARSIGADQG